jgi:hypothetical protein
MQGWLWPPASTMKSLLRPCTFTLQVLPLLGGSCQLTNGDKQGAGRSATGQSAGSEARWAFTVARGLHRQDDNDGGETAQTQNVVIPRVPCKTHAHGTISKVARPSAKVVWEWFAPCVGLGFLVRPRVALRSLALWRVFAIAPSFVSGWRAFSSVSLCKSTKGGMSKEEPDGELHCNDPHPWRTKGHRLHTATLHCSQRGRLLEKIRLAYVRCVRTYVRTYNRGV